MTHMASYIIELGVQLNTSDLARIKTRINNIQNSKKINLEINKNKIDSQLNSIRKQIQNLSKIKIDLGGNDKNKFALDTGSLKTSLDEVRASIQAIKTTIGTLDDSGNMKPLISSINQISTALDNASNQFTELNAQLSSLSKKDFNVNIGVNLGRNNSVANNIDYSNEVKSNVIPKLKQQIDAMVREYNRQTGGSTDQIQAYLNLVARTKFATPDLLNGLITRSKTSLIGRMDNASKPKEQMEAYKEFIETFQQAAKIKGLNLSSVVSGFSETPDDLIKGAQAIQTGAKQTEDSFTKLKQVLGSGIGVEQFATQLKPIIDDLNQIREAVQNLSKGVHLDNLTSSFNRLSKSIEDLLANAKSIQNVLGTKTIDSGIGNGVSKAVQDQKDLSQAISQSANEIKKLNKVSFDISDNGVIELRNALKNLGFEDNYIDSISNKFNKMNIAAKNVSGTLKDGKIMRFDIKGIESMENGLERVITLTKALNKNNEWDTTLKYSQPTTQIVESDFERLKTLAKEIGNLRVSIFKSDDISNISKAKTELDKLNNEYDELFAKTKGGLSTKQISQLDTLSNKSNNAALSEFKNKLNDLIRLQEKIENTRFEIGKIGVVGGKNNEVETLQKQLKDLEDTYEHLLNTLMKKANINGDIVQLDGFVNSFKEFENGVENAIRNAENRLERFKSQYADTRAELARSIKIEFEFGTYEGQIDQMDDNLGNLTRQSDILEKSVRDVRDAYNQMEMAIKGTGDEVADRENLIRAEERYAKALKETSILIKNQARLEKRNNDEIRLENDIKLFQTGIDAWLTKNSAAVKLVGDRMQSLRSQAEGVDRVKLNNLRQQFQLLDKEAETAGLKMQSFGDRLKTKFKEYASYFSAAELFMYVEQALRSMFEQVRLIDTAMTELKKVTNESDAAYNQFLNRAASRSKEIGTTIDGLVSSTADFARLGYGFEDAQGLAEVANIYAVVGDEINGVEGATESLISTMAAFKGEMNGMSNTDFAMSIIDKFNEVGKLIA